MGKFICPDCKGDNVHVLAWVDANTNEYTSEFDDGSANQWCDDCKEKVELVNEVVDVGYHTSERTKAYFETLTEQTQFTYSDTSWKNDLCDSFLLIEKNLHIFVPNSDVANADNEEFSHFTIRPIESYGTDGDDGEHFDNLEAVIKYINNDFKRP